MQTPDDPQRPDHDGQSDHATPPGRGGDARERVDWASRYDVEDTPWDLGGPHPELSVRLQDGRLAPDRVSGGGAGSGAGSGPGGRVLVPGAGRAHDALALARRGWTVTALDLVGAVADRVGPELERHGGRYVTADAFTWEPEEGAAPFDLVWDHTFFCAIDPSMRAAWGARARSLVAPGGRYAALVFPVGKPAAEGGPPFGMDAKAVLDALGASFRAVEDEPVQRSVPRRTWRERWLMAERAPLAL